jgi:hypothetical protein
MLDSMKRGAICFFPVPDPEPCSPVSAGSPGSAVFLRGDAQQGETVWSDQQGISPPGTITVADLVFIYIERCSCSKGGSIVNGGKLS